MVSGLAAALLALFFIIRTGVGSAVAIDSPQITGISRYDVTLKWNTDRAVIGSVKYRSTGTEFEEAFEEEAGTEHELKIGGLQSDTIYDYYLNNTEKRYSFKTAPGKDTSFRLMVYQENDLFRRGDWSTLERNFNANLPDFAVVLSDTQVKMPADKKADFIRQSDLSAKALILYTDEMTGLKSFYYGNSKFLFVNDALSAETLAAQLKTIDATHVFAISSGSDPKRLKELQALQPGIVLVYPGTDRAAESSLVIPLSGQALIVDVDGDGVIATRIAPDDSMGEIITVKETPESVKKSCVYCRKLLEAKKYQDSIDWYRDFIKKYQDQYIVDDAQFQIANIYDRYLYDYRQALTEYQILLDQFPNSTKAQQALQRIEYINGYSDYDFEPLASFEKTKSETYKNDKAKAIQTIEDDVKKYPDAKLLNTMLFWLGHVLSQDDLNKSIFYYTQLLSNSSGSEKKETLISMGDVYYTYKQYQNAIEAYTQALTTGETKYNFGVQDKIHKSRRNIERTHAVNVILVLLGLTGLGAILIKPRFFTKTEILRTGILLLVLLLLAYSAWWVFYQNYPEVAKFIAPMFLMLCSGHLVALTYSRKIFSRYSMPVNMLLTSLLFIVLSLFLYYVFLYQYHYLPSLGL